MKIKIKFRPVICTYNLPFYHKKDALARLFSAGVEIAIYEEKDQGGFSQAQTSTCA